LLVPSGGRDLGQNQLSGGLPTGALSTFSILQELYVVLSASGLVRSAVNDSFACELFQALGCEPVVGSLANRHRPNVLLKVFVRLCFCSGFSAVSHPPSPRASHQQRFQQRLVRQHSRVCEQPADHSVFLRGVQPVHWRPAIRHRLHEQPPGHVRSCTRNECRRFTLDLK
jgi:hypothetical protein